MFLGAHFLSRTLFVVPPAGTLYDTFPLFSKTMIDDSGNYSEMMHRTCRLRLQLASLAVLAWLSTIIKIHMHAKFKLSS